MAAGLLRRLAGNTVRVGSAGTNPGTTLNALSAQHLAEVGIDITRRRPSPSPPGSRLDPFITLDQEATIGHAILTDDARVENWATNGPST